MESLSVALVSLASVVLVLRQTDATFPLAAASGLLVYVMGTVVLKLGKALIYPFYISKLRHLPGPKVWQIAYDWWLKIARKHECKRKIKRRELIVVDINVG